MNREQHPLLKIYDYYESLDSRLENLLKNFDIKKFPYIVDYSNRDIEKLKLDSIFYFYFQDISELFNEFRNSIEDDRIRGVILQKETITYRKQYYNKIKDMVISYMKKLDPTRPNNDFLINDKSEIQSIELIAQSWGGVINEGLNKEFIVDRKKVLSKSSIDELRYRNYQVIFTHLNSSLRELVKASYAKPKRITQVHDNFSLGVENPEKPVISFNYNYPDNIGKLKVLYHELNKKVSIRIKGRKTKDEYLKTILFFQNEFDEDTFVELFSSPDISVNKYHLKFACEKQYAVALLYKLNKSQLFRSLTNRNVGLSQCFYSKHNKLFNEGNISNAHMSIKHLKENEKNERLDIIDIESFINKAIDLAIRS